MSEISQEQFEYILQFMHAEKLLDQFPVVNDETVGALFGLSGDMYRAIRDKSAVQTQIAAEEMLDDQNFARMISDLPFGLEDVIVGVGDSFTDDDQSWFEIFRSVLDIHRPQDQIKLVNAGISMQSTPQIVSRVRDVLATQPNYILLMLGANDAQRIGPSPKKTLVSIDETKGNLQLIENFCVEHIDLKLTWITPTPVIEEKISVHWMLGNTEIRWRNEDIAAIASLVRAMPSPVTDLGRVFNNPVDPELMLSDGLHPSIAGHKMILREVVTTLLS